MVINLLSYRIIYVSGLHPRCRQETSYGRGNLPIAKCLMLNPELRTPNDECRSAIIIDVKHALSASVAHSIKSHDGHTYRSGFRY